MQPEAATYCRGVLDRFRAQLDQHLPALSDFGAGPVAVLPLERLPTVGQLVQQLVEAEAVYASANVPPQPAQSDD